MELKIYHLDQDPTPARHYGAITGATVIVNQRHKLTRISAEALEQTFARAVAEMA